MKMFTQNELNNIIELHKKWVNNEQSGVKADLRCADLRYANLNDANLRCANLNGADLRCSDLRCSDLRYADLNDADLNDADLWSTVGNRKHIKSFQVDTYDITYTSEILQIGCENHKIEEWFGFDDRTISEMDNGALEWWCKWKDYIKMTIDMSPAVPTK